MEPVRRCQSGVPYCQLLGGHRLAGLRTVGRMDLLRPVRGSLSQNATRIALGAAMIFAGTSHLTFAREEFQAQVPSWIPLDEDFVVVASGIVEIGLGAAQLVLWRRHRRWSGAALALFYVAVFPGNVAQYTEQVDAFGLDTDTKRLVRLFFQPALVGAALWGAAIPQRRRKPSA